MMLKELLLNYEELKSITQKIEFSNSMIEAWQDDANHNYYENESDEIEYQAQRHLEEDEKNKAKLDVLDKRVKTLIPNTEENVWAKTKDLFGLENSIESNGLAQMEDYSPFIKKIISALIEKETKFALHPVTEELIAVFTQIWEIYDAYMIDVDMDKEKIIYHVNLEEEIAAFVNSGKTDNPDQLLAWFKSHRVVPFGCLYDQGQADELRAELKNALPYFSGNMHETGKTLTDECNWCFEPMKIFARGVTVCPKCGEEISPCRTCKICFDNYISECPWGPKETMVANCGKIVTPLFGEIVISDVLDAETARYCGYTVSTGYESIYYDIFGRRFKNGSMAFVGVEKFKH